MKRGRPSAYDPMFCELILDYFEKAMRAKPRALAAVTTEQTDFKAQPASSIDADGKRKRSEKTGYLKKEVRRICAELPTIEGFAVSVGIPSSTLKQWAHDHQEFADAYARAKDIQRTILVDRGLTRQYDPAAFMFVAKNITDMTDKQILAGDSEAPLSIVVRRMDRVKPGQ